MLKCFFKLSNNIKWVWLATLTAIDVDLLQKREKMNIIIGFRVRFIRDQRSKR